MDRINKTETLYEILNSKTFTINVYQREYRWGRKQIEQLINDITDCFLLSYENNRFKHEDTDEVAQYGYYFMGSIIRTGDDSTKEIVDGQQRLTSLTLLLMYINKMLHEQNNHDLDSMLPNMILSSPFGSKKTYNIDVPERKECMDHLYKGETNFSPVNESSQTLLDRYLDIIDLFRDEITPEVLPYFACWVMHKILLLEIVTPSEQEAHTIFITMNDRGLSLNSAEMLKAFVLNEVSEDDKLEVNAKWQELVNKIKTSSDSEQSGVVNTADVEFISLWLRGNYAKSLREGKKDSEDKDYELLGEKFHEWVRQNAKKQMGLTLSKDYKEFVLKEMSQMVDLYLNIKQCSKKLTEGFESVFYNANRDLNYQTLLMISAIDKDDEPSVVDKKIKLVAKFVDIFASNRILNFKKANFNTNKVFLFKVLVNIRNKCVKEIAIVLTKALQDAHVDWDKFIELNYENQFFKRYTLHFIARFASHINIQMGNPSEFDTYVNRKTKNPFDIEHILPDMYPDYAEDFDDEREFNSIRHNIGNLMILTKDKNRSYQEMKYDLKVQKYLGDNVVFAKAMNSLFHENNPLFVPLAKKYGIKPYGKMDKVSVRERADAYLNIAKDIWNIDAIKEEFGGWTEEEYNSVSFETARKVFNNDNGVEGNTVWVISGNNDYYDVIGAFNNMSQIEWQQHANFEVGDIVYIYMTLPFAEISYKCRVLAINIEDSQRTIDDSMYYKSDVLASDSKYMRLELIKSYPSNSLTLKTMKESGVTATFQGPTKAVGVLLKLLRELDNK